ncbi:hypothetical protein [Methylobacterium brachythecii]|uniref:3',5'-cyclic-nucleotide phosphodiesterase n=1 Tax=Methylobacterium brachythecii TaxID=1176177 RepID=A0A7W6F9E3_9HYPH|nr:hypothetical protein [Methylobacterium brachythecii]MBB3905389.1 hypothetical protein [Methylobacterium brachythecii]GLS46754.1 hypothetical protein GCM10007884_47490 [Methylobacterium brachythecii]
MLVRTTVALLLGTSATLAAPEANREALRQYCTGDYLSFCSDFAADSPEVKACFKQNKAKLTPDCRAAIASYTKAQKRG